MPIKHVFVLMLENRSYDHLMGLSNILGTDAETGQRTAANGLPPGVINRYQGKEYGIIRGAEYRMPLDPPHEFPDVLEQLCGPAASYPPGGAFPAVDNSGYVASYAEHGGAADPGAVMKCYTPEQLPVLNTLAQEFALCDNWHASMPGPTWPNRMFVHAASSAGLDHSPSVPEILLWETLQGFSFPNGTLFELLQTWGVTRRLYSGDDFPMVAALKGVGLGDVRRYEHFADDLQQADYPYSYIFIEPSYDVFHEYRNGNSEHPLGDLRAGESLIKQTYEAIRNSPHWNDSLLIVTWDEHGGFYDHAIPPAAHAPGDTSPSDSNNRYHFTFECYGPRVPALVISPWIPRNTIDHRVYDHASVPRTVEKLFGLPYLTERDHHANDLSVLLNSPGATHRCARVDSGSSPAARARRADPCHESAGDAPGRYRERRQPARAGRRRHAPPPAGGTGETRGDRGARLPHPDPRGRARLPGGSPRHRAPRRRRRPRKLTAPVVSRLLLF